MKRERKKRPELTRKVPIVRRQRVRVEALEPATWRLVISAENDGAMNMAIDEAIAESVAAGESLPTLRFYGWSPPCLSLGRTQSADVVDFAAVERFGWQVVRRASGGRAVLHIDELTYSIAAMEQEPRVKGGVLESYRRLSAGLLRGLKAIEVLPERAQAYYDDQGDVGPACYDGPSDYEITIGQRKLIGSAQRRSHNLVLQHGSIPLYGDITRIVDGLDLTMGEKMALRNRLRWRAVSLEYATGKRWDSAELTEHLVNGFAHALQLDFQTEPLSAKELERANVIRAEKFGNDEWTMRK